MVNTSVMINRVFNYEKGRSNELVQVYYRCVTLTNRTENSEKIKVCKREVVQLTTSLPTKQNISGVVRPKTTRVVVHGLQRVRGSKRDLPINLDVDVVGHSVH